MKTSESIANIAVALIGFQSEVANPEKKGINPHFKSKYAELDDIINTIRPTLEKHGLAFIQNPVQSDGQVGVYTVLIHKSGEYIQFDPVMIPLQKVTPHQVGAALTYAKRYSLGAALGLATEEDKDGNDVGVPEQKSQQTKQPTTQRKVQQPSNQDEKTRRLKAMFAEAKTKGLTNAQLKAIVFAEALKESSKDLTLQEINELHHMIRNHQPEELQEMANAHLVRQKAAGVA